MSWTQGLQGRDDLPENFVKWADAKVEGARLECIVWDTTVPSIVHLDYYTLDGYYHSSATYRITDDYPKP